MIEALIGHTKNDGLLDRNWLKGKIGDALHVVLYAAGHNLRLILRAMKAFFARRFPMLLHHYPGHVGLQHAHQTWLTLRTIEGWLGRKRVGMFVSKREVYAARRTGFFRSDLLWSDGFRPMVDKL